MKRCFFGSSSMHGNILVQVFDIFDRLIFQTSYLKVNRHNGDLGENIFQRG